MQIINTLNLTSKATNEFVFWGCIIFFFSIFLLPKKERVSLFLIFAITILMILWRSIYNINSSRYAIGTIFPLCIAFSYFLNRFAKTKLFYLQIVVAMVLLYAMLKKDYSIISNNSNLSTIAEYHDKSNEKKQSKLMVFYEDKWRIKTLEKNDNPFEVYYKKEHNFSDVYEYSNKYISADTIALYNVISSNNNKIEFFINSRTKIIKVLSVFSQKNRKKRFDLYKIETNNSAKVLLDLKNLSCNSGLLINGDFERRDSLDDSFGKLKNHISNYQLYFDKSRNVHTPFNAYFHNDKEYTKHLPFYDCNDIAPISGKYSVSMKIQKGFGYLFFSQKFLKGQYDFSLMVKGKPNTTVCMIYDKNINGIWHVVPTCKFDIPDNKLYLINTQIDVNDLTLDDYFIIGVWVCNGDVLLDNFKLSPHNP